MSFDIFAFQVIGPELRVEVVLMDIMLWAGPLFRFLVTRREENGQNTVWFFFFAIGIM